MTEIETATLDIIDDSVHHVTDHKVQIKFTQQYAYISSTNCLPICVNRLAFVSTVVQLNSKVEENKVAMDPIYVIKQGIHTTYLRAPVCSSCARAAFKIIPLEGQRKVTFMCVHCKFQETYDTWTPKSTKGCDTCD